MKAPAKRFFKQAALAPLQDGYTIELDGRPVHTPLGQPLVIAARPLANAIVAEWQAQGETIAPKSMPLAGFANTSIDRVGAERSTVLANLMNFANTDLLCYRAEQPADLAARQHHMWQPVLDWAADVYGVHLITTSGVLPVTQPEQSLQALEEVLSKLDDITLTALASLAAVAGSLIVALAVIDSHLDADHAFEIVHLDVSYQNERWGVDDEARALAQQMKEDMDTAFLFLSLSRQ